MAPARQQGAQDDGTDPEGEGRSARARAALGWDLLVRMAGVEGGHVPGRARASKHEGAHLQGTRARRHVLMEAEGDAHSVGAGRDGLAHLEVIELAVAGVELGREQRSGEGGGPGLVA